jgi:hypothetical protein
MKGGYFNVDCSGLDLNKSTAQTIEGIWDKAVTALRTDKPIVAYGCTYGTTLVSPVPVFGWYIAADEIVIVGATLHVHIKDNDSATVLDVVSE